MKIYIAGPMQGIPEFNYPFFNAVATQLRQQGHEVANPAEINAIHLSRHLCMANDIRELITCRAIMMLPGWENSRGAKLEREIALQLELQFLDYAMLAQEVEAI